MSWVITGTEKNPVDLSRSNVSLLLHGDGTNGSTTITDSSPTPKTVSAFGNAQISTAQSKFGGSSIAFDGTGDYVEAPSLADFAMHAGNFTLEAWVRPTSTSSDTAIISLRQNAIGGSPLSGCVLGIIATKLAFSNGTSWRSGGTSLALNTWSHVACTRNSGTMNIWLNGVADRAAFTENGNFGDVARPASIGRFTGFDGQYYNGYIDDLRITKGVARYTANFTPPTAAFPDI
jgi:hypothetical protein